MKRVALASLVVLLRNITSDSCCCSCHQTQSCRFVDVGVILTLYHMEHHLVGEFHELFADALYSWIVKFNENMFDESCKN